MPFASKVHTGDLGLTYRLEETASGVRKLALLIN